MKRKYQDLLKLGYKSEESRAVLTQSMMSTIRVQCDLRNLMNFFRERLKETAQKEIREVAQEMFFIMKEHFPLTTEAFEDYILNAVTFSKQELKVLRLFINKEMDDEELADYVSEVFSKTECVSLMQKLYNVKNAK